MIRSRCNELERVIDKRSTRRPWIPNRENERVDVWRGLGGPVEDVVPPEKRRDPMYLIATAVAAHAEDPCLEPCMMREHRQQSDKRATTLSDIMVNKLAQDWADGSATGCVEVHVVGRIDEDDQLAQLEGEDVVSAAVA